jgi:hypothetical protein
MGVVVVGLGGALVYCGVRMPRLSRHRDQEG